MDSKGHRWANVKEFEACSAGRYEVREYMGVQVIRCDGQYARVEELTNVKKTPNLSHSVPVPGPSRLLDSLSSSQVRVVDFQGHESIETIAEREDLPCLANQRFTISVSSSDLSFHEKIFVYLAILLQPTLLVGVETYFSLLGVFALFVGSCLAVSITRPNARFSIPWKRDILGLSCVIVTFWSTLQSAGDFLSLATCIALITLSCSIFQHYVMRSHIEKSDFIIFLASLFFLWILRLCCSTAIDHWWGLPLALSTYIYYCYLVYLEKPHTILYRLLPLSRFSKPSQLS